MIIKGYFLMPPRFLGVLGVLRFLGFLMALIICGCSNFEDLRKEKFEPDYATKYPTTFFKSKELNGRFVKNSLAKAHPLMYLKKGLGYSVYQLPNGDIGEVANEAIRPRNEGETFTAFYNQRKLRGDDVLEFGGEEGIVVKTSNLVRANKSVGTSETYETYETYGIYGARGFGDGAGKYGEETFPILNNSLESVEPALPQWD